VRLLLIALVAAGLGMMHTLGHARGEHAGVTGHHVSMPTWPTHEMATLTSAVGGSAAVAGDDAIAGFDPMTVCLAVLFAGFVILLVALLAGNRRASGQPNGLWVALARGGRAPPAPALGLRLANLSVLRT
jgi:hypothetical protein